MTETVSSPAYLEYFERLRGLDRRGALDVVRRFLEDRPGDIEGLYADLLMPAMVHTGEEWEGDRISVAHEHYISEVTRDLIRQYGPTLWSDTPDGGLVAVAGCAPGERHSIGLMMVCDVLRASGIDVHALGEGAPAEDVSGFAAEVGADLLCLSCALDAHLGDARDLIEKARGARPEITVLVGGAAFGGSEAKARAIGADHYAADVRGVRRILAEIVGPD